MHRLSQFSCSEASLKLWGVISWLIVFTIIQFIWDISLTNGPLVINENECWHYVVGYREWLYKKTHKSNYGITYVTNELGLQSLSSRELQVSSKLMMNILCELFWREPYMPNGKYFDQSIKFFMWNRWLCESLSWLY